MSKKKSLVELRDSAKSNSNSNAREQHAQTHTRAIWLALFVTFLWSTSWVLIKIGLGQIPPLLFAGLRYGLAFVIMLPWLLRPASRRELAGLQRNDLVALALLGLVIIAITQGAQFIALAHIPAHTLSLLLSLSTLSIAFLGVMFLGESLRGRQWMGVAVTLIGALIYFGRLGTVSTFGLAVGVLNLLATSIGAIQGRALNRQAKLSALTVTGVSIGVGSAALLVLGLLTEPWPTLSGREWLIILWLAAVNTAFAFTLWNHSLRTLTAAESGVINNTMLIQIAILAWVFLGERISPLQGLGLLLAAAGTVLVQWKPRTRQAAKTQPN
ncbi:MAG: EamA family transporter [Anaerolineales bacterium]|nr:MAG: EamA family transporter [Anaerolineales bacterium]